MKHKLLFILGLIVLGWAVFASVTAEAATGVGSGPTISWDRTLRCTTKSSCPRFVVLTNMGSHAVLDKETGLVWEQSPSTSDFIWEEAQIHCNQLGTGGRLGWRLPTLQELESLVDPSQEYPTLPKGHPFSNVQSSFYWSATTRADNTAFAWYVSFFYAYVDRDFDKNNLFNVWCVRGGQGVDPQ